MAQSFEELLKARTGQPFTGYIDDSNMPEGGDLRMTLEFPTARIDVDVQKNAVIVAQATADRRFATYFCPRCGYRQPVDRFISTTNYSTAIERWDGYKCESCDKTFCVKIDA